MIRGTTMVKDETAIISVVKNCKFSRQKYQLNCKICGGRILWLRPSNRPVNSSGCIHKPSDKIFDLYKLFRFLSEL